MKVLFLILFGMLISFKSSGQEVDSVRIYYLDFQSLYFMRMDEDLIKTQVEPRTVLDTETIKIMMRRIGKIVKAKKRRLRSKNTMDVRLLVEIYSKGGLEESISFSNSGIGLINGKTFYYRRKKLELFIDEFYK